MTTPDELAARLAAEEVPWSALRERRVLTVTLNRWTGRRRSGLRLALAAAGALAAAATVAAIIRARPPGPTVAGASAHPSTTALAPTPAGAPPLPASVPTAPRALWFADGSRALLGAGAEVAPDDTQDRAGARIVLRQRSGEVTYHVAHDRRRPFVVRAADVEIHVVGTVFSVGLRAGRVAVSVDEGVVEVHHAGRDVRLAGGDELVVRGDAGEAAHAARETRPSAPARVVRSAGAARASRPDAEVTALLARADAAREAGDPASAARALHEAAARPDDGRRAAALFTLGRVERRRGSLVEAADAFAAACAAAPEGPLAEDARAEEARAWSAAGDAGRARAAATIYLATFPGGVHAAAMRELAR